MGHGMMGGAWKSKTVADPLYAKGVALFGDEDPVVFVSVDWCEIRNEAYDQWRDKLAAVVGTSRERVLVSAVHQHEAPVADLEAQRILERLKLEGSICDLKFHEKAVEQVALALKQKPRSIRPQKWIHSITPVLLTGLIHAHEQGCVHLVPEMIRIGMENGCL